MLVVTSSACTRAVELRPAEAARVAAERRATDEALPVTTNRGKAQDLPANFDAIEVLPRRGHVLPGPGEHHAPFRLAVDGDDLVVTELAPCREDPPPAMCRIHRNDARWSVPGAEETTRYPIGDVRAVRVQKPDAGATVTAAVVIGTLVTAAAASVALAVGMASMNAELGF